MRKFNNCTRRVWIHGQNIADTAESALLSTFEHTKSSSTLIMNAGMIGLYGAAALTISSLDSYYPRPELPRFESEPHDENASLYENLAVNPDVDTVLAMLSEEFASGSEYDASCPDTYVYHTERERDRNQPQHPEVIQITDIEAMSEWYPVATYSLRFLGDAVDEPDGSLDTDSEAFKTYSTSYEGIRHMLRDTLGSCNYARGDVFEPQNGLFGYSTGPYLYGFNTFYVQKELLQSP